MYFTYRNCGSKIELAANFEDMKIAAGQKRQDRWNRSVKFSAGEGIRLLVQFNNLCPNLMVIFLVELLEGQFNKLTWRGFVGFQDTRFGSLFLSRFFDNCVKLGPLWWVNVLVLHASVDAFVLATNVTIAE